MTQSQTMSPDQSGDRTAEAVDPPTSSPLRKLNVAGMLMAALGGLLLTTMMGLTVFDVIGRYVFNAPIKGAAELTEVLLCATIFLGLGAVSLADDHVVVDLVTDKLPGWIHPWRLILTGLCAAIILFVVGWRIWIYATQIGGYGGTTTNLKLPIAPLGYFCALCCFAGGAITGLQPVWRFFTTKPFKG